MEARTFLQSIMPTQEMVDHFVNSERAARAAPIDLGGIMCNNALSTFDAELGWTLTDGVRSDGVDGSWTFYNYEPNGARRVVNFPDRASRIHTYGNSYTHCDQVSESEDHRCSQAQEKALYHQLISPIRFVLSMAPNTTGTNGAFTR